MDFGIGKALKHARDIAHIGAGEGDGGTGSGDRIEQGSGLFFRKRLYAVIDFDGNAGLFCPCQHLGQQRNFGAAEFIGFGDAGIEFLRLLIGKVAKADFLFERGAARGTAGAVHGMVVENDAVSVACKGRVEFDIGIALRKSRLKGRQGVFGKFCGHAAVCFKNHGESLFCS